MFEMRGQDTPRGEQMAIVLDRGTGLSVREPQMERRLRIGE